MSMNYQHVFEVMVNETAQYLTKSHLKTMVLGLSGGLDSTVTAAICHEVVRRHPEQGFKFIGVSMPCSTNSSEENDSAMLAMRGFCDEYWVENLQKEYLLMRATCEQHYPSTALSQGNIKARLRMIYLYNIASVTGGLVMDTDNLTEHNLGFWTIHGDVADYNPIGGLWKHEVYGLAKWLKENKFKDSEALDKAIAIMPTDGNGVKAGGDLAQIAPGKTYDDVDEILHAWVGLDPRIKASVIASDYEHGVFKKLCEKHGKETVEMVIERSIKSEFKRKQRPFVIDIFNGNIVEKNGKLM